MGKRFDDYHAFSAHMEAQENALRAWWANPPPVPPPMTEDETFEWMMPVLRARQEFLRSPGKAGLEFHEDGRFRRVMLQGIPICNYEGARPTLDGLKEIVRRNLMDDAARIGRRVLAVLERSLIVPEGHRLSADINGDVRFIEHTGSTQFSYYITVDKPNLGEDERREWERSHTWISGELRMKFAEPSAHVWLREETRNPAPKQGDLLCRYKDIEGDGNKFLYCSDHNALAETFCAIHNAAVERYRGFEEGFADREAAPVERMKG